MKNLKEYINESIIPFIGAHHARKLAGSQSVKGIPTNGDNTNAIKSIIRNFIESNFRFTEGHKFNPQD